MVLVLSLMIIRMIFDVCVMQVAVDTSRVVLSPMPGVVRSLSVAVGDKVRLFIENFILGYLYYIFTFNCSLLVPLCDNFNFYPSPAFLQM